jgi:hypothetical protein
MKDVVPYCDKWTAQLAVNAQYYIISSQSWANISAEVLSKNNLAHQHLQNAPFAASFLEMILSFLKCQNAPFRPFSKLIFGAGVHSNPFLPCL